MILGTELARLGTLVSAMRRRTWLTVVVLAVGATACGVLPGSTPAPTVTAIPGPTPGAAVSPSPAQAAASPSPSPAAAATAAPTESAPATPSNVVYVGNTDGEGVYLRKTPNMEDRLQAYPDGTRLTIIGDDVEGDGQTWKHVRAPDGSEGYVPAQYTTSSPG